MQGEERGSIVVVDPGRNYHRYATAVEHAVGYYLAGSKCKHNLGQKSLLLQ